MAVCSSPIAGNGLFFATALDAGIVVVRLGGRLVDTAELHRLLTGATSSGEYIDTFAVGDDTHIVLPTGTTAHFGNHSCEPTVWPISAYELATRRPASAMTHTVSIASASMSIANLVSLCFYHVSLRFYLGESALDPANVAILKRVSELDRAARTVVCVGLLEPGWLVEIEAIAAAD